MRKRILALICTLALSVSLIIPSAFAVQAGSGEVLQVLSAMGVMNGDANGDLHLDRNVKRSEFTKMAVTASVYKDMATADARVSPFADVKYTHWAAGYIKTGVDALWINGYLDGTFRPDSNVKLEEAVNICLKMLGYTDMDFSGGTYPYPQLALYRNLGMDEGIRAKQGEVLVREDCAQLIYNTLNTVAKSGKIYAMTLGYGVDAVGEIDYLSVVNAELDGPVVVRDHSWTDAIGFVPDVVYRNDKESTIAAITKFDVLYYLESSKTVWAYHNQVTGVYESVSPSRTYPETVTISGIPYGFESSSAAYAMSAVGKYRLGDTVTLLLGRNHTVVAVIDPDEAGAAVCGIVMASGTGTYVDAQGKAYTAPYISILGVDGVTYQYQTTQNHYCDEGDLVKVSFDGGDMKISSIRNSAKDLSGKVNSEATALGRYRFADDVKIMDYIGETAITVPVTRLAGVQIDSGDIAYYELNNDNEIEILILKNVTGDMFNFGILIDHTPIMGVQMVNGMPQQYVAANSYTVLTGNQEVGPLVCENITFPVQEKNAVRYLIDGTTLDKLYNLTEVKLTSVDGTKVVSDKNQRFNVENGVQVYLKKYVSGEGTKYYMTSIDNVNDGEHTLTGWYDKAEKEGGRMRVIVASEK